MFSWFKKKQQTEKLSEQEAQEFIAQIPTHAEQHRKTAQDVFGVELDYSAESIAKLDEIISQGWKKPPHLLDAVVLTFGSYLGEAIRRLHGGEWHYTEDYGFHLAKVGGKDVTIFPLSKVNKRFINGEEDSLGFYYSAIRHQLMQPDEP